MLTFSDAADALARRLLSLLPVRVASSVASDATRAAMKLEAKTWGAVHACDPINLAQAYMQLALAFQGAAREILEEETPIMP